jgi:hypothetical protein
MAASGQPSVVINVNSPSIIDEESVLHALLTIAQNNHDSFYRGTGGATNLVGNLSMSIFNPGLESDHWRCSIPNCHFGKPHQYQSGRTNIYEQAQAGYTNLEIINLDQSNVDNSNQ